MKRLLTTITWDLRLQMKYHIVTVYILVTALYCIIFLSLPIYKMQKVLISLVFADPTMLGFMFIGGLVLFEKSANTLQAVVVTPLCIWQYLFSKALSLTLISLLSSFVMVFVGHGTDFNAFYLFLAVVLSSVFFVFIGFVGVAWAKSLNQYLIYLPIFITPLYAPLINFFGEEENYWWYVIPTQASLVLFNATFEPVENWKMLYAVLYLSVWCFIVYKWAEKAFIKYIILGKK